MIGLGLSLSKRGTARSGAGGEAAPTARFFGDPYTQGDGDDAIVIRVRNASIGAVWEIEVTSSGGGTPVTDTDTVAAADFDITLDITGLNAGSLASSYSEDSVEVSTDVAMLLPPFDDATFDADDIFFDSTTYTFDSVSA